MVVKTPSGDISAKVHVLMTTGDIPALGKMACHVGHMSKDGCRICHVVGQSPGHGQYFRMPSAITMRTPESFKHFDEVASSSKKGLTGQSPFSLLDSFSGPFFFALDEMHGICHGIGKQVWGLVCGKYGKDHPLSLSLAAQKEIDTAMVSTRRSIPTSFHGAWINIATRSGYFRAVDWADFILFVIPTLVAERVCDQAAPKGEVQLKVFTINQHLLQHYPAMIEAYGPPRAYSARSVERAIGKYSRAIKSNSAIGINAGNIMLGLTQIQQMRVENSIMTTATVTATTLLQYDDSSAGSNVGTDSDIEFWGPLRNRTIVDSFGGISCLPELLQKFYESKGEECSMIEAAIKTSRKAFVNGCVIDSALDHNCVREAHNVRLQVQVDENRSIGQSYSPVYKDFFGKVVVFFEHKLNNKRWPLVLVNVYAVRLVNSIPAINNGQMKPMVVHLADVKELVGLVKSDATINTITTTATTYVVWPELNRGPKLSLGSLADL
ncbi:hypothetical protein PHYBLDRAFT_186379 [Phycomyces blakesleeanus NRRL 1555(-)]|uniref:Uncharacterized protein n=1 Tax=Phycomyces blakesleeanus (strain ATCC 8743b / DSM 1359 / FGSC 10004 / NBRC 33097 / NRRL 1555) TaxID=763407 RepID=A0A162PYA5_PHYB8|nr:hypothetical protein PHYBLDRAFT_186379 [Phycomyces blakesleeanus NRRL 1555(-)]OAD75356.1 hypothetical protein PHYBLDRAFT_186379 [Phycomyces blakesleeanus NRRL 1555(-)]|eukprot:XP_018293396.1 hypothetical protein PHYBLDRAFT_186379 [Phycomyces blakesleeanus NRRL 1555(-)]